MTDREIMQMALEALEVLTDNYDDNAVGIEIDAIIALRERLAQPDPRNQCGETCERAKLCAVCLAEMGAQPEQEPVAWLSTDSIGEMYLPTPPQKREWQGLTDEEYNRLVMEHLGPHALTGGKISVYDAFLLAIRATEAKLKEKND